MIGQKRLRKPRLQSQHSSRDLNTGMRLMSMLFRIWNLQGHLEVYINQKFSFMKQTSRKLVNW